MEMKDKMEYMKEGQTNEAKTRPDTRLSKSHSGGQEPHMRSLDHLGRSSEVKDIIS